MNSMEIEKVEESNEISSPQRTPIKTEERDTLNSSNIDQSNPDESFDQIELKIEKEEIISNGDFYTNPKKINKKISTPFKKNIDITYRYKKVGNTFTCFYNREGDPLILIGPHCKFLCTLSL